MNTTGIFSNSSRVIIKYTQTGGSFKTYAARKVRGTVERMIDLLENESQIEKNVCSL